MAGRIYRALARANYMSPLANAIKQYAEEEERKATIKDFANILTNLDKEGGKQQASEYLLRNPNTFALNTINKYSNVLFPRPTSLSPGQALVNPYTGGMIKEGAPVAYSNLGIAYNPWEEKTTRIPGFVSALNEKDTRAKKSYKDRLEIEHGFWKRRYNYQLKHPKTTASTTSTEATKQAKEEKEYRQYVKDLGRTFGVSDTRLSGQIEGFLGALPRLVGIDYQTAKEIVPIMGTIIGSKFGNATSYTTLTPADFANAAKTFEGKDSRLALALTVIAQKLDRDGIVIGYNPRNNQLLWGDIKAEVDALIPQTGGE